MKSKREAPGNIASTVVTAVDILEYIADRGKVYPRDITHDLGLNRSTVHRMLYTLERLNYVDKYADGRYRLTFRLFEIGNTVPHSYNLIDTARRELLELSHITGFTVNHGINYADQVLYVDKATPAAYLQLDRSVGESEPLHCTSIGKVLLAHLEDQELKETIDRLALTPYTPNTLVSPDTLYNEIIDVRKNGYAVDRQELAMEVRCVAVPVHGHTGANVSGISVSGPEDQLTLEKIERVLPTLQATAARIERNIRNAISA
ncbi:MAG: IclR family transcriptional regulator [Alkalispirochaeta sp.]|jgi:DNA-binding IclR family transcriptional regulator